MNWYNHMIKHYADTENHYMQEFPQISIVKLQFGKKIKRTYNLKIPFDEPGSRTKVSPPLPGPR